MNPVYAAIGRLVVEVVRWRYRRQLRIAAGAAVAATMVGIGAYVATRDDDRKLRP